jgi:hypothetical protein
MTDQPGNDGFGPDALCTCGDMHKGHICWLSHMGLIMEVRHLTDNPTVSCTKCGAKANLPHNVCFPAPPGNE